MNRLLLLVVLLNFNSEIVTLPIKGSTGFKLPKPLKSDTAITINGTMITDNNSLTVALSEKGGSQICEFTYNTATKIISMKQSKDPNVNTFYEVPKSTTPVKFSLHIEPKLLEYYLINFELNVNDAGPSSLQCLSRSIDTVNRIVVKGAESVNSLLFQYDN